MNILRNFIKESLAFMNITFIFGTALGQKCEMFSFELNFSNISLPHRQRLQLLHQLTIDYARIFATGSKSMQIHSSEFLLQEKRLNTSCHWKWTGNRKLQNQGSLAKI